MPKTDAKYRFSRSSDVRKHFSQVGTIENLWIIRDNESQFCKGIGYVTYSNKDEMRKALKELADKEFQGWVLWLKKAVSAKRLEKKERKKEERKK